MKLPGKKNKDKTARRPAQAAPRRAPTQPIMDGLRRESPAQAIDLSGSAFQDTFPALAERLAEQKRQHQQRREQESSPPANQTDPAAPARDTDNDKDEET